MNIADYADVRLIVPLIKPKSKGIDSGCYFTKYGSLYFTSGNNIVRIREHFPDIGSTPEALIENTIRYDNEYLSKSMANDAAACYNTIVNDVL